MNALPEKIPCPFVYRNGKRCTGHIVRIEAYKADLCWELREGGWLFDFMPRSHYHLFCSEKGNHAGLLRDDDARMKFYRDQLPDAVQRIIMETRSPNEGGTCTGANGSR